MSHDTIEGTVLTGEDSVSTEVALPTLAQVARRIGTLTAKRAADAIETGGKALDKLVETTDALYTDNARLGAKVKDNDTFLGAYAYALHVKGKGMSATDFAAARGITKSRVTQYARTWRLFAEYEILPGTAEWAMTSTWQNSSDATVLFGKRGPAATREEFLAAYAASKRAKVTASTDTDTTASTDTDTTSTDTASTDTTGTAPDTAASTSASGTSATGDNRVNRPNGESHAAPDFTGWKGLERVKYAQTALMVKKGDVKDKESRAILAAIMATCASLLED